MEKLNLIAQERKTEEKLSEIRAGKMIPAVVYWKNQKPISIKVDYSEFLKLFRISWESHIINLKIEKKTIEVLVHEIQKNPISGDYKHVDFYALTKGEKVTTKVTIKFVWASQAVKEGAILEENLKEVEIKVLPTDLIDFIEVDLSLLKEIGENIRVSELNIDSSKIEILTNANDIVVVASKPAKEEVEVVTEVVEEETTDEKKDA